MVTLRDPQKVISPAGWSPPLGGHRSPGDRHSQVIATKPGDRPPRLSHRITSDHHYPGDRHSPVIATANQSDRLCSCKWSQLIFSMELKVWVEGIQRIVCGVTEKTTCQVSSRHDPDHVGSDRFPGLGWESFLIRIWDPGPTVLDEPSWSTQPYTTNKIFEKIKLTTGKICLWCSD